ncbi:hypothetical protein [Natrarchaeobius chitinivorans]|uniref:hypothetical protein n=1 Tax=Natrarchaeobius chitinivorans TaxID=1679083 RepID=UPI000F54C356|nr:hypothetical protein [Natrarchaeobius chitinivorans]
MNLSERTYQNDERGNRDAGLHPVNGSEGCHPEQDADRDIENRQLERKRDDDHEHKLWARKETPIRFQESIVRGQFMKVIREKNEKTVRLSKQTEKRDETNTRSLVCD